MEMTDTAAARLPMPKVKELRIMASKLRVRNYSRMRKDQLIWAIQEAEGNAACFKRIPDCSLEDCLFRGECIS
jgi:hypothetical protein